MVKLTREQVNEIRQRIRNGETIVALSREFDVYETTLRKIKYGRSWREEAPNASVFSWRPA
jgi:transposase-like protein